MGADEPLSVLGRARLHRLRKNSRFLLGREGYEFHSCRNCRPINGGFQPLGECCPAKGLFPRLFSPGTQSQQRTGL